MNIMWRTPMVAPNDVIPEPNWPDDWPVPGLGDQITQSGVTLIVTERIWYPEGEDDADPFVYVILCRG